MREKSGGKKGKNTSPARHFSPVSELVRLCSDPISTTRTQFMLIGVNSHWLVLFEKRESGIAVATSHWLILFFLSATDWLSPAEARLLARWP